METNNQNLWMKGDSLDIINILNIKILITWTIGHFCFPAKIATFEFNVVMFTYFKYSNIQKRAQNTLY